MITHLMLFGATLFWGLNPIIMKIGFEEIHPLIFNVYRLTTALSVSLLIGALAPSSHRWKRIEKQDILPFITLALGGFFLFQAAYIFGVDYTAASVSAMILAILPVFVASISLLTGREQARVHTFLGIGLSAAGVAAVSFGGKASAGTSHLTGVILLVFGELSYAVYTLYVSSFTKRYPVEQIVSMVIAIVLVPFTCLAIPVAMREGLQLPSLPQGLSILYTGIFGILGGNLLWSHGVKRIGSIGTSIYINLTPLFGVIAAYLLLSEHIHPMQLGGGGLILLGVFIVNRS